MFNFISNSIRSQNNEYLANNSRDIEIINENCNKTPNFSIILFSCAVAEIIFSFLQFFVINNHHKFLPSINWLHLFNFNCFLFNLLLI